MSDQIKFEVTCDSSFLKALNDLASRVGKTQAETVRDALNFYENALNEWERSKGSAKSNKQEEQ